MQQTSVRRRATTLSVVPAWLTVAILFSIVHAARAAAPAMPDFQALVAEHSATVVNIETSRAPNHLASGPAGAGQLPEFLRRFYDSRPAPVRPEAAIGSGVIASRDGYILTNAHVVADAEKITVRLSDRRELPAELIGSDSQTDIALLKVEANNLPAARFGNSDDLKVGQWVLAIGAPFGLEQTATQGIVSAVSRSLPNDTYVPFIQTDVALNPGNSGGPLFNLDGEVIGINSQIFSRTGGYMGLSFAIPINLADSIADQLRTAGHIDRGWLGIAIQDLDPALAQSFGLDNPEGALVSNVTPDSPAARGGLRVGDVIVEFNGETVERSATLPPLVAATAIDSEATVQVKRDGKVRSLTIVVGRLENLNVASVTPQSGPLGVVVSDLTRAEKSRNGLDHGVRVDQVQPGKPAAVAGIQENDIIVSFNHAPIDNVAELAELSRKTKPGSTVPLLVQRENRTQFLALNIPENLPG